MGALTDRAQYAEEVLPSGKKFPCLAQSVEWNGKSACLLTGRLKEDEE